MSMPEVVRVLKLAIREAHDRADIPIELDEAQVAALAHHLAYDAYLAALKDEHPDDLPSQRRWAA